MIKTLQTTLKQDKEQFKVPRSVQDIIPIRRLWPDGIFQFGSKYSKTLRFSDINYAIASKEDKTSMFLGYSELLNALDTGSTTKITINNKRINRQNFEQDILIPPQGDYLDGFRAEYNAMLLDKVTDSSNSVVQERYITLSVHKKNVEEARTFFDRTVSDAVSRLNHMDSHCEELDAVERLRILHDFYRVGEETQFQLDLTDCMKRGRSFKDAVCPDSMEFKKDHFVMGGKYGRVLFLKEYASYIKDAMINELTSLNRSLMLSIDIIPVPTDEAVREMQNRLLGVETNVTNWQRRQNSNNNFSAVVPYDLEQQRKETREMLDDLTTRDQRMMFAVVTLVHLADSKEELDSDTETLQSIARKHLCQLTTLNWQQADGLVTALPLGLRRIDALRTLTTEALAVLMPFKAQEIWDRGGVYYGQNAISKNLIVADRKRLLNGNAFILGVSGSGKSFSAKKEMVSLALSTDDDIIIIDPESEYRPLVEGLGGQVINISATSPNHINAMDMEQGYGDGENPVVLKSEFLLSLCEQLIGAGKLSAKEKSIIDRCTAQVYRDYIRGGYQGQAPTLQDFHAELLCQPEKEATDVALAIELFTEGSLNTFHSWAHGQAITKETVTAWKNCLVEQKYAPSTINTMLAALNRLFAFMGWTDCCAKYLKVQRRMFRESSRELTKEEYTRLVNSASHCGETKLALLMETICSTGIRVSEVKYITIEAIRVGKAEIHLKGKIRTILISAKLCRKLIKYAEKQKIASGAIFCAGSGKPMSRYQIWAAMKKICRAAGVDPHKVYPHNLRHLFAVAYYKVYKDIARLADTLGHSSIETTRIYLLTSGTEHRQQLEGLGLIA